MNQPLFEPSSELLDKIGQALTDAVPGGWKQLRLEFLGTVQIDAARLEAVTNDDATERYSPPRIVMREFDQLRSAMYRPDIGTWFTAEFVLDSSGKVTISFDYDHEPNFVPQLTDGAYALDFDYFPRDDAHTPQWLRDKLRRSE
ncbi:hypothetical protein ACQP1O_22460 [Nocardia sp. CA-151230]|uniref:hypothetical protein n=1 Tax=Nocardia sp. CA-151230 TaxID=3239982 RepID=UPI003D9242FD